MCDCVRVWREANGQGRGGQAETEGAGHAVRARAGRSREWAQHERTLPAEGAVMQRGETGVRASGRRQRAAPMGGGWPG